MTANNPETAVRSWLIRLGKYGEMESNALETGELVTGFSLGDLTNAKSKDAVLQLVSQVEPDSKPAALANRAAQINQFVNSIQDGDLAVVPLKTTGQIAIGRLSGKSFQSGGGFLSRKIKWLRTDLPRQAVKQDL